MSEQRIEFTNRELGVIALAITKMDILMPVWCDDHDDEETSWLLTKIVKMQENNCGAP